MPRERPEPHANPATALGVLLVPAAPLPMWKQAVASTAALALATALSMAVTSLFGARFPAAPFFPAVLFVTAYAGISWGALVLAASAAVVWTSQSPTGAGALGLTVYVLSGLASMFLAATLRDVVGNLRRAQADKDASDAALRQSEARMRLAQDAAGLGIWDWDLVNQNAYWSPAFFRNLRIDPDETPSFETVLAHIHPEDRDEMVASSREALRRHGYFETEYRVPQPDGSMRWLHGRGEAIRDADGRPIRLIGLNWDVTERRLAEEELRRSEARLKLAQDAGGVGLWDWDLVTGAGYWSEQVYRNLGLDPAGPVDIETMFGAIHPEDIEAVQAVNRRAVEQGRMDPVEYRVIRPNGEVRWLLSRGDAILDKTGKVVRVLGVNIDVTDRRQVSERLRESETRFRDLANSAPAPMWVTRLDRRREFVNQAYFDFLGMPYQQAVDLDWRTILHPEDVDRITAESIAGEATLKPFMLEGRYRGREGDYRWIRSYSQPRFSAEGALAGFIGIAFDITEVKQAQADLTRINELLEERISAALAERDTAQAALAQAQRMESLGQLTGGVAHDFNNLLTVIVGGLDLMLKRAGEPERVRQLAAAALSAAHRGEQLTQQLLAFARRQPLKPQALDVDALVAEAEPLLARAVGAAHTLTVAPGAGHAVARLDPAQFQAVLLNLVVNARDALGDSAGEVTVGTRRLALADGERDGLPAGDYVEVVIRDTGPGMEEAVAARAFEPFFTTKPVGKGTGLGLSQVYGFARQSGGGATLESRPGEGTIVRLFLPLEATAAEAVREPAAAKRADAPPMRILLVEDDIQVGALVEEMLGEMGHDVVRAVDGASGLAKLKRDKRIDLLLTDLVMPGGLNGLALAEKARALRPSLPVVLSSGYAGEASNTAEVARFPLLRKPYTAEALARIIAEAAAGQPVDA